MNKAEEDIMARVFKIESLNTHNGPGYRTVIYLKGCPLHCLWCHNPESITTKKEIWWLGAKCIGCHSCVEACPNSALSAGTNGIEIDRNICAGCYTCADICPSKAIEKIGEDLTVSDVFNRVLKDKPFLEASGGGVTLTGGEPGIAPEFVAELFSRCRDSGIHTAFDTSGFISKKAMELIIPNTDLVFFDLKVMEEERAKEMTGQGISQIMKSLEWIIIYKKEHGAPELQFRTPIIPGSTDSAENMVAIAKKISDFSGLFTEWELNLFNDICEDKYQRLNKKWHYSGIKFDQKAYGKFVKFQEEHPNLKIKISGFYQKE